MLVRSSAVSAANAAMLFTRSTCTHSTCSAAHSVVSSELQSLAPAVAAKAVAFARNGAQSVLVHRLLLQ
jgi:hypothetical protein